MNLQRLLARKSIAALQLDAQSHGLKRSLSAVNLLLLGIGCILGAGIYVLPGLAAAQFAGPAVVLSFVIAGTACALTALCYAELASSMPVSGSAYAYCYAAIGEVFAWALGWMLIFEFGLAAATLAVGFSGYLVSLLGNFGVHVPALLVTPFINAAPGVAGGALYVTGGANLVAAFAIALITLVLTRGVHASAFVNNLLVFIKVSVLLAFIVLGVWSVDPGNWTPFVPPSEGSFHYGWAGVMRAASILFFAYLGFEVVSTAAAEARNPGRDLPIGILGSLAVCTVIYIVVSAILTGIVPYRELGVPDPIAVAMDRTGHAGFAVLVKLGALIGLSSVLLVNAYGQSRVAFAMSRDGLLPPLFSRLHPRLATPVQGTILFGIVSALGAALLPLSLLSDLISVGVASSFIIVCLCTMWLRSTQPGLERPFRVPLGGLWLGRVWLGWVPMAGILMALTMIVPVVVDLVAQAREGQRTPALILGGYVVLGLVIYFGYGIRRSKLGLASTAVVHRESGT